MILNKFIDKTLEAAKQSALQIYGDDYSNLTNMMPGDDKQGNQDEEHPQKKKEKESEGVTPTNGNPEGAVVFERSHDKNSRKKQSSDRTIDQNLKSIRKYAAQQTTDNRESFHTKDSTADATPPIAEETGDSSYNKSASSVYSRKAIRPKKPVTKDKSRSSREQEFDNLKLNNMTPSPQKNQEEPYDQLVQGLPNDISERVNDEDQESEKNDSGDIHKRLDRLESLMHLALSTPDAAYYEHPLYHKLLHKGVSQKLIKQWFEHITAQGIEPTQQADLFYAKLLQQIDECLEQSKADTSKKVMIFTGRSGAGKTHLIMKLASIPNFLADKKIGIACFAPTTNTKNKYSILEPFCNDKDIDFYRFENTDSITALTAKWDIYDHILIDTPSLEMDGQSLSNDISTLQKSVARHTETETHYLVNTAVNGTAFNDPLAQEVKADHLALTHIDQSLKWGKTLQLLTNTDYKLRYISSGPSIAGNLLPFDPEKFARKLLRA